MRLRGYLWCQTSALKPETCVNQRNSLGGTSTSQVEKQLAAAGELLQAEKESQAKLAAKQI